MSGDDDLAAAGGAWPQWLGPHRNGSSSGAGLPESAELSLREIWRRPLEESTAGIAVANGPLYTLGLAGETLNAIAVDTAQGTMRWSVPLDPPLAEGEATAGTPVIDARRVFAITPVCRLHALDADDGKVIWRRDLRKSGIPLLPGGCVASLLLAGDLLVTQAAGEKEDLVIAVEKDSGEVRWTAGRGDRGHPYSFFPSPSVGSLGGVEQVVVHRLAMPAESRAAKDFFEAMQAPRSRLFGLRLSDGKFLWSHELQNGMSFDTPLILPEDRVLLSTWNDTALVKIAGGERGYRAERLWDTTELKANGGSPAVYYQGNIFGFKADYLTALDAVTGTVHWQEKIYEGCLIRVGEYLLVLSQFSGLLRLVQATPQSYQEKARLEIFDPGIPSGTPPSFVDGRVYARNPEELIAVAITMQDQKRTAVSQQ